MSHQSSRHFWDLPGTFLVLHICTDVHAFQKSGRWHVRCRHPGFPMCPSWNLCNSLIISRSVFHTTIYHQSMFLPCCVNILTTNKLTNKTALLQRICLEYSIKTPCLLLHSLPWFWFSIHTWALVYMLKINTENKTKNNITPFLLKNTKQQTLSYSLCTPFSF